MLKEVTQLYRADGDRRDAEINDALLPALLLISDTLVTPDL